MAHHNYENNFEVAIVVLLGGAHIANDEDERSDRVRT